MEVAQQPYLGGSAKRDFAVVASEVKTRAAQAAEDVTSNIGGVSLAASQTGGLQSG